MSRLYTVLFVKRDGRWLISSVREEPDPLVRPHERLKDLEWMIGDWLDEGADSVVRVNCRWSDDGNFLIRSFTVHHRGKPVMTVAQRIGWTRWPGSSAPGSSTPRGATARAAGAATATAGS